MDLLEQAYSLGHQAYHDGYRLKNNPYKRHTEEWEEWKSGWNDEEFKEKYITKFKNAIFRI